MPWWAVLIGYAVIPLWGPAAAAVALFIVLLALPAASGHLDGDAIRFMAFCAAIPSAGVYVLRWRQRATIDWTDYYRRLRARDFGPPR